MLCKVSCAVLYLVLLWSGVHSSPRHAIGEQYHPIAYGRSASRAPPQSEYTTLKQFYATTGGRYWTNNEGWLSDDSACTWFGVVCDATNNSVSALLLSTNNLVGSIPNLTALTGLEVFDVSFNSLSGSIPPSTFASPVLKDFYINNNKFNGSLAFFSDFPDTIEVIYVPENDFSGTLPSEIGRFTSTYNFQLFSNEISGTIPQEVGNMASLESLDFGFNSFSGNLPDSLGNLSNIQYIWLYDDDFEGPLPETMGNLKNLVLFEVTRNRLSGAVPDSFANMESLQVLRLGSNQFTGVPSAICSLLNLTDALLYKNNFTAIPACQLNSRLTMLRMSNNELTGDIPEALGDLQSLKRIDLSHNKLTGTTPQSFAKLNELLLIDFSHNSISASLSDMMMPLSRLTRITAVDISHNYLYGTIPYSIVWNDATQEELSKTVTYLYINNNNLTGDIPEYLSWMYRLKYADLSYNNFTGPIPEALSFLSTLLVQGNPLMFGVEGALPSFLQPDYKSMKKSEDGSFVCPSLRGTEGEYDIQVDPTYFNYSFCSCEANYWGVNGTCKACPKHATCPGGGMTVIVAPGYWPIPNDNNHTLLRCSHDNFGFTPCNPDSVYPFACKAGYEDRLCSKCAPDHFPRGIECIKCLSKGRTAAVVVFLALVVIGVYGFFLYSNPMSSLPSAARKTAMFYFQALNLLLTRFAGWPVVFSFLATVSSAFNFGFNYTCVFFDFYDIFYVTIAIPLYCVVLNAVVLGALYFFNYVTQKQLSMKRWILGSIRTFLLTLNFMYLPLCVIILSMFVCIGDTHTHHRYLATAPWLQCDHDPRYSTAVSIAVICFVLYVLGIPALIGYLLYRFRNQLEDTRILMSLGALYVDYTESTYFFELLGLFRRFLFALVIAVVKQDNLFLMSMILFLVLVAYAGITAKFRPFNYRFSNNVEMIGLAVLTFNLVGILAATSNSENTSNSQHLSADPVSADDDRMVMQVFVLLANLAYILLLIATLFFGVSHMILPQHWKNNLESISSIAFLSRTQTKAFSLKGARLTPRNPNVIMQSMDAEDNEDEDGEVRVVVGGEPQRTKSSESTGSTQGALTVTSRSITISVTPRPDTSDDEEGEEKGKGESST